MKQHKTHSTQKQFISSTFWAKYSLFYFILVASFVGLMVPLFLQQWTDDENHVTLEFKVTNQPVQQQTRLPFHDPEDIRLVRELSHKLMPPAKTGHISATELPYPSIVVEELRALTDYKRGGYFIEVGSGDKDLFSDTLFFERFLGWTGLLVEPDLINMKVFRRNAWIAPACMSLNNSAYEYHHQPYIRYHGHDRRGSLETPPRVVCYPFHTFWLALNRPVIDYFSLDVGGGELEILETIPFDKVDIKIIHVDFTKARNGFMGVTNFLQRNGFKVVSELLPNLLFFIKRDYVNLYNEI